MKNSYDGKTAFVFAAFDAEKFAANEDVAWIVRVGAQRLPKGYSIGYVLLTKDIAGIISPTPVAEIVPDLPDDVVTAMNIESKSLRSEEHTSELQSPMYL